MPIDLKTERQIAKVVAEHLQKLHGALQEDFGLSEVEIVTYIREALPEADNAIS